MTNLERIKALSSEEIATLLAEATRSDIGVGVKDTYELWLSWLEREEVKMTEKDMIAAVKEIKKYCEQRSSKGMGCHGCVFYMKPNQDHFTSCILNDVPDTWDLRDIESVVDEK